MVLRRSRGRRRGRRGRKLLDLCSVPEEFVKRDRTARLLNVAHLLFKHPRGLTAQEIANRVGMNVRTVYRDVRALEEEVGVAVWQHEKRFGAEPTSFLPPLKLTLQEAVTLFLSTRLMARYQDRRDPHVVSAFNKLASVLPAPIAQQVHASVASLAERPRDDNRERVFDLLATAWAEGRKVQIWYPSTRAGDKSVYERLISPYFLEPNPSGHTCYLIGLDSYSGRVRTFKIERVQQAELTDERFTIPADFDLAERLRHAWGISDEDPVEVRLRFHDASAAARARESHWHPSQREVVHADGTVDLTFEVGGLLEIKPWILGWGGAVEVLSPAELRQRVAAAAREQANRYEK
jgi:predicted DNA-binding transcriptional regulator YafY